MMRREEQAAFDLVARVLRVNVVPYDNNSSPAMVDALFATCDGLEGALEVTTIAEGVAMAVSGLLGDGVFDLPCGRWGWYARLPAGTSVREFRTHLVAAALACEETGVTTPSKYPHDVSPSDDVAWFTANDVELTGVPGSTAPGRVSAVLLSEGSGMVDDFLIDLAPWLDAQFAAQPFQSHVEKLQRTGRPEQHLFVRVFGSSMPEELLVSAAFHDIIPEWELSAPRNLTGLWLVVEFASTVLFWSRSNGWQRHPLDG
jgi:hypothetical protein